MIIDKNQEKALLGSLDKRASGSRLKNSEISLLHSFDRARQHGESIMVKPVQPLPQQQSGAKPNIPAENIEGFVGAMRTLNSSEIGTYREFNICDSGVPKKILIMVAGDPY